MTALRDRVVPFAAITLIAFAAVAPSALSAGSSISATEGISFSSTVAVLTATQCTPVSATATINWGDGNTGNADGVALSGTQMTVTGTHTYTEEGTYSGGSVSVSYMCPTGGTAAARTTLGAQVADAALTANDQSFTAVAGQGATTTVATFTDADPGGSASDYTATINWGDGTGASAGTVAAAPGGGFAVSGIHTYAAGGSFTVTSRIADAGGSQAAATASATVVAAGGGNPLALTPGTTFTGPVGQFTPQCLSTTAAGNVHATINWGDGAQSPAQVLRAGSGTQLVLDGSHTYSQPGTYTGTVVGGYTCGSQPFTISPVVFTGVVAQAAAVTLRAQGLDITQGILDDNYLLIPSGSTSGSFYRGMGFSPPDFSGDPLPGDSPLIENNGTIVRFYADAHGATGIGLFGVGAALYGFSGGHPLPGSPLLPEYGPSSLPDTGESGAGPVFLPERVSDKNAYTFKLPASWTSGPGPITLTGQLMLPPPSFTPVCNTSACQAQRNFTMTGVTFVHLPTMTVAPVQIIQPSESALPSPQGLYARPLLTEPGGGGYTIEPYVATLDPTDVINHPFNYDPKGDQNNGYLQLLENWGASYVFFLRFLGQPVPDLISGVNLDQRGVTPCCHSTYDYPAVGYDLVITTRPLTSIGHELGHDLGRNHADEGSSPCGGGGGPWPPDHQGFMQGIGLDTGVFPYKILYPGLPGDASQYYDKMSYCAGANESIAWTSPYGWLHSLSALWLYGMKVGRAADPGPVSPHLLVTGVLDSAGGRIVAVQPTSTVLPQPSTSALQLVALDAHGHVLSTVNLSPKLTHDDPSGRSYFDFAATVPAHGVKRLEVRQSGVLVAQRIQANHKPYAQVLAPAPHALVGGPHAVTVRWKAGDTGKPDLLITVAYSANGGRSWRVIYLGPNRGHVKLPSWYFAGSHRARVRVIASDGWSQGSADSRLFTAVGSPPKVLITSPGRGFRIPGDARLQLSGEAFDQTPRLLGGRRLQWFDGPFALGSGGQLSAEPLPPGRNLIRLVARDGSGLRSSATLAVLVSAARLPFLHLHIRGRVARGARRVRITASADSALTLTVNGHRYALSRHRRTISLAFGRGSALLLEMAVTEQGVRIPFAAKVVRPG
jgi:hypothetical protein